ncbi:TetR/AcrR family transcriptional regulator [Actinopolymorpha pittospori]|uniref:AcrR family transcriptional regulator n=1 Tax=Actinopolymorpha pittospori TaxID=648752 RepID=A0A927MW22_9ACTN|nr:TetR/AcrR family transcriptional regulator [Actinopolymorpha pittospori]MBE1604362.1 AcrR family transcriptional regulator [Actinopolymorpha pittospori]
MTRSAFLRARRPEHKQQRREAILTAARDLARASGVRNVSLGAVAEAAGLAKSNIARYFGTREEIYLELLTEEWGHWAQAVSDRLRDATGTVEAITALAETLADRPLFCDLLSHVSTSLEHNVSVPAARTFKHAMHDNLTAMGAEVARATELTERESSELVAMAGGLAGMLYRAANPPPVLAQLYAEDPELADSRPTLLPTLVRTLSALAAGLPTLRDKGSR